MLDLAVTGIESKVFDASLQKSFPEESKKLVARMEKECVERYKALKDLAEPYPGGKAGGTYG